MVKIYGPNKPALNIIICIEEYHPSWDHLEPLKNQGELVIFGTMFITYIVMLVPLYIKRKRNEKKDAVLAVQNRRAVPKSLESLLLNFAFIGLTLFSQSLFVKMNKYIS